jgi:hypothetical protein
MAQHVQAELRRRFVDSCLPKSGVETAFEP